MKTPIVYKDRIIIENDFNCDGRSIDEGIYTVMEFRDKEEVNVKISIYSPVTVTMNYPWT